MRQLQEVIVTRLADRHADDIGREFAVSWRWVVEAGPLWRVLQSVTTSAERYGPIEFEDPARFTLTVGEPYDADSLPPTGEPTPMLPNHGEPQIAADSTHVRAHDPLCSYIREGTVCTCGTERSHQ